MQWKGSSSMKTKSWESLQTVLWINTLVKIMESMNEISSEFRVNPCENRKKERKKESLDDGIKENQSS